VLNARVERLMQRTRCDSDWAAGGRFSNTVLLEAFDARQIALRDRS